MIEVPKIPFHTLVFFQRTFNLYIHDYLRGSVKDQPI